jgi:hypothetical protein
MGVTLDDALLAFGVNIGNVGRAQPRRRPMAEQSAAWNAAWREAGPGCRVLAWFRHTGNFVLAVDGGSVTAGQEALARAAPNTAFAVFAWQPFQAWLADVRAAATRPPAPVVGRRWTPGMVMALDPSGGIPPAPTDPRGGIWFGPEAAPRLRIAWRHDWLDGGGTRLDRRRREGGWGAVASLMGRHAGGTWTARALSTVEGLVAAATNASGGGRPRDLRRTP